MSKLPARRLRETEDTGNGRLRWQVKPAGVHYITPAGDEWRVYDCVTKAGKPVHVELQSSAATSRVFVGPPDRGGVKKLFSLKTREIRKLSTAAYERQLRESEFLGATASFDPSRVTAR